MPGANHILIGLSGGLTDWWRPGEPVPAGALCWTLVRPDGSWSEYRRDWPPDPDAEFVEAVYEAPIEGEGEATR